MMLDIKKKIGPRCMIKEDGQRVFDDILPFLKRGESVILNFDGVSQFASPFFNFAIGQLFKELSGEQLQNLLKIENLNEAGKVVVKRVVDNAEKYHADKDYRKIVDDMIERQAKE